MDLPGLTADRALAALAEAVEQAPAEVAQLGGTGVGVFEQTLGEGRLGRSDIGRAHHLRVVALAPGQQERVLKPVAALLRLLFRVEGTLELLLDVGVAVLQLAVVVDAAAQEGDERDGDDGYERRRGRPPPRPLDEALRAADRPRPDRLAAQPPFEVLGQRLRGGVAPRRVLP
ncbi:MAG TPA: hypothetical protein VKD72_19465, partial [Gemmataceae bacterium]|nr:hypothetical protein [Gemmataceae bacterium]